MHQSIKIQLHTKGSFKKKTVEVNKFLLRFTEILNSEEILVIH